MSTLLSPVELIDETGQRRLLGNLVPEDGLTISSEWPIFGVNSEESSIILRSEWESWLKHTTLAPTYIKDQKDSGLANSYAITSLGEALRRKQGLEEVILSPGYLHGGVNSDSKHGSSLEEVMTRFCKFGCAPLTTVAEQDCDPKHWPTDANAVASDFIGLEPFVCPSFTHIVSATHQSNEVVLGIYWGKDDKLDAEGWMSEDPQGGVAGSHTVLAWQAVCRVSKIGLQWGLWCLNSFSKEWGVNGWFFVPEARIVRYPFAGAWTLRRIMAPLRNLTCPV